MALSWWQRLLVKVAAVGVLGASAGALVASSRGAEVTTGVAWGWWTGAVVLLAIGAYPGHQQFRAVPAALPQSVRQHTEANLWERLGRPSSMLSNGLAAIVLAAAGTLVSVFG